jgi:diguanylate cyclase (GGDEF)-like protein/PAS domain S-box-containing protein
MNVFSLLSLMAFMAFLSLGLYAYYLDPKSRLNRILLVVCLDLSWWTFAYAFVYSAQNKEVLWIWFRISALSWCLFGGITLHFLLVLAQKDRWLRKGWPYALLYGPGVVLTIRAWTGVITARDFVQSPLGWVEVSDPDSIWFWLHLINYIGCVSLGTFLVFQWGVRSRIRREKKQARIIGGTILISLFLGILLNVLLPALGWSRLPSLTPILVLIWAYGIWQAMIRYRFMGLTPAMAAEEIIGRTRELLILADMEGRMIKINHEAGRMLGYEEEVLTGQYISRVLRDPAVVADILHRNNEAAPMIAERETECLTAAGQAIPLKLLCSVIKDNLGQGLGLVLVGQDLRPTLLLKNEIAVRTRAEEALLKAHEELEMRIRERTEELFQANTTLQELAYHDSLTGLPNRSLFFDRLNQAMTQAQRGGSGLTLMMLDLDNFKGINDTLGHNRGDALLLEVGGRLTGLLRKSDTVARLGGDEFMILLPETADEKDGGRIAEKILEVIQLPYELDEHTVRVTVSIGLALYPKDGETPELLMKNADAAMYQAKEKGRNRFQYYAASPAG